MRATRTSPIRLVRRSAAALDLLTVGTAGTPAWADPSAVAGSAPDGPVTTWSGFVGDYPTPAGPFTAVVADDTDSSPAYLGIRPDRTVVGWTGPYFSPVVSYLPPDLSDVRAVDIGDGVGVALKADGTVVAWGSGPSGAATVPSGLGRVVSVAAGGHRGVSGTYCGFVVAARADGTVRAWGETPSQVGCGETFTAQAHPPAGLRGVVSVAAGREHALALRDDGTVVGWGNDEKGQASPPTGLDHVVQVVAGGDHSLALRDDGTVVAWGAQDDRFGVVRTLRRVVSLSTAERGSVALLADGSTRTWDFDTADSPTEDAGRVPSSPGLSQVSTGLGHGASITVPTAVGAPRVMPRTDTNPVGRAEAFRSVASSTGTTTTLSIFVDPKSAARTIQVGLYADAAGSPGTLLASGTIGGPVAGAWNRVTVPATAIRAGRAYWLAVLAPVAAGVVRFRDLPDGTGGRTSTSKQTNLTALPTSWTADKTFSNGPASIYAAG